MFNTACPLYCVQGDPVLVSDAGHVEAALGDPLILHCRHIISDEHNIVKITDMNIYHNLIIDNAYF